MSYIFVVGNSRSGTSMLSRIIGKHTCIFTIPHEIHFFEEQWDPTCEEVVISQEKAVAILSWLLCVASEGYLKHGLPLNYQEEASSVLQEYDCVGITPVEVYKLFLNHTSKTKNVAIVCEQTPRYLLFTNAILRFFPDATILNMVRDPRDILLSQKNKWRVRYLGAKNVIPLKEAIRSWINYHPFTIALLWKRSIETALQYRADPRFISIRYEDMVSMPEQTLQTICSKANIEFQAEMLNITVKGSSTSQATTDRVGVVDFREKWKQGGVSDTEIYICEKVLGQLMGKYGYTVSNRTPNPFSLIAFALLFLIKTPLALIGNMGRTKNIWQAISRRLFKQT